MRLITDLRLLNACHQVPKHKTETWQHVLQVTSDPKLKWGLTLDLKSYYHHLQLHPNIKRWMRFKVSAVAYQVEAMPFGWALAPWWANKFNKPIRTWMNQAQIPHCWWIDNVLILGEAATQVDHRAITVVNMLTSLGIQVNLAKSMQHAAQQFPYVGHQFNLQTNVVEPLPHKQTISHNL